MIKSEIRPDAGLVYNFSFSRVDAPALSIGPSLPERQSQTSDKPKQSKNMGRVQPEIQGIALKSRAAAISSAICA
jgi:hypothetical protein